ncbi:hypothetical protein T10_9877 [Trichinella papuae]|uniref:Uncharacterized protein n=1 Tax=Trichinella papuae TaxID=268474 RepID=A0A0V1MD84_9BILA|nr:hypothetical protein T10_9877 [Trichinella papuae]
MRSKRPTIETELYELVEQAQHFTITRQLLSCKRSRLMIFYDVGFREFSTIENFQSSKELYLFYLVRVICRTTEFQTEEYTFPYRLLKEIIQSSPLDGMVEAMCSRIIIRQKNDDEYKNEAKRILIRLNEYLEKICNKLCNFRKRRDLLLFGKIGENCCRDKWYLNLQAHQEKSISLKIALICGNQFFASNKCDQQIMSNRNVHLPTATMAVSTVNYMQYDSSPDVWNFDDQEKELSDVQLMALQLANLNCIVQFLYK